MTRRVWAIADLHLGFGVDKPMDRWGPHWVDHAERIRANCARVVGRNDVLLLPGDLSWATKRAKAQPDLEYMARLPGLKVCIKGNHDFWWPSDKPLAFPGLHDVPLVLDDLNGGTLGIAGSRGWNVPDPDDDSETAARDRATLERERRRLTASLAAVAHCDTRIVMTHYPPHPFLDLIRDASVASVAYGHVHVRSLPQDEFLVHDGDIVDGVQLYCVACDRIDFKPKRIA